MDERQRGGVADWWRWDRIRTERGARSLRTERGGTLPVQQRAHGGGADLLAIGAQGVRSSVCVLVRVLCVCKVRCGSVLCAVRLVCVVCVAFPVRQPATAVLGVLIVALGVSRGGCAIVSGTQRMCESPRLELYIFSSCTSYT